MYSSSLLLFSMFSIHVPQIFGETTGNFQAPDNAPWIDEHLESEPLQRSRKGSKTSDPFQKLLVNYTLLQSYSVYFLN